MFLLSTDIDGTIYDGERTAQAFADFWSQLRVDLAREPILAYNTGRSLPDVQKLLLTSPLPTPEWMICGVGTTIFHAGRESEHEGWYRLLEDHWDFDKVVDIVTAHTTARAQPPECQSDHKSSWYWDDARPEALDELEQRFHEAGLQAQAVYSSNRDLDVLPAKANKGGALRFLAEEIGVPLSNVVVSGDSGNDTSMFLVDDVHGVVVANAEAALREATRHRDPYHSRDACAHGVIEGIQFLRDRGTI